MVTRLVSASPASGIRGGNWRDPGKSPESKKLALVEVGAVVVVVCRCGPPPADVRGCALEESGWGCQTQHIGSIG